MQYSCMFCTTTHKISFFLRTAKLAKNNNNNNIDKKEKNKTQTRSSCMFDAGNIFAKSYVSYQT